MCLSLPSLQLPTHFCHPHVPCLSLTSTALSSSGGVESIRFLCFCCVFHFSFCWVFVASLNGCVSFTSGFCWQHCRLFFTLSQLCVLYRSHFFPTPVIYMVQPVLGFSLHSLTYATTNLLPLKILLFYHPEGTSLLSVPLLLELKLFLARFCWVMGKKELLSLFKAFLDCICLSLSVSIISPTLFLSVNFPSCAACMCLCELMSHLEGLFTCMLTAWC